MPPLFRRELQPENRPGLVPGKEYAHGQFPVDAIRFAGVPLRGPLQPHPVRRQVRPAGLHRLRTPQTSLVVRTEAPVPPKVRQSARPDLAPRHPPTGRDHRGVLGAGGVRPSSVGLPLDPARRRLPVTAHGAGGPCAARLQGRRRRSVAAHGLARPSAPGLQRRWRRSVAARVTTVTTRRSHPDFPDCCSVDYNGVARLARDAVGLVAGKILAPLVNVNWP
mmetsp:Transcript_85556/g.228878  ORF Transcript_85556/g.228878 Transcript_85556/m.228878 type:complete len:221 (+) Transcript_85556:963-1625(+)